MDVDCDLYISDHLTRVYVDHVLIDAQLPLEKLLVQELKRHLALRSDVDGDVELVGVSWPTDKNDVIG